MVLATVLAATGVLALLAGKAEYWPPNTRLALAIQPRVFNVAVTLAAVPPPVTDTTGGLAL